MTSGSGADPVRLHVKWSVRLLSSPFVGVFAVGVVWGIVESVVYADIEWPFRSSGGGAVLATIGWIVALPLGALCATALLALWRAKIVIYHEHLETRALLTTRVLPLDLVDTITLVNGRSASATAGPTFDRLDIRGRTTTGRRTGASINSAFMTTDLAVLALTPWVQARPDIITNAATRALFYPTARH